ncbi:MAG: GDP-mannose 4,6-dehydratase [Acidobacteria bacterium]|nr:GDP-mannose 4,6-dehydratase [Acidobacteriota bacterium]
MKNVVPIRSVLIFGGAGFIGSNWAHHLLKTSDAKVHIFDNLSRRGVHHNLEWLKKLGCADRLEVTVGDIRDAARVEHAVERATEIYHFAAQVAVTTSVEDPRSDLAVNVGGTFNILEAARKTCRRPFLLFTSTNKVYGSLDARSLVRAATRYSTGEGDSISELQPLDFHSPYGCSKGAADQYVHDYARIYEVPTVVFRMSCIAGPRQFGNEDQGWVAHFLYSALRKERITIYGDGRQVRDVLAVEDLISAFEAVRNHLTRTAGEIYNVGGGFANSVSLLELIEQIRHLTGQRLEFDVQPVRPGDQAVYVTHYGKLHRDTGWQPQQSVTDTLAKMYAWWKENRELFRTAGVTARFTVPELRHAPGVVS